jgi:hypothetical protein
LIITRLSLEQLELQDQREPFQDLRDLRDLQDQRVHRVVLEHPGQQDPQALVVEVEVEVIAPKA